uniref:Uncharacterized protein n=1 Tax=Myoviridae sp. ctJ2i1 TaxID=2825079 RepID=A0A8S5V1E4_9CAUD|nr:MAG TPA: hypothetical protein [Myoviridae sp. ctJ2i1]
MFFHNEFLSSHQLDIDIVKEVFCFTQCLNQLDHITMMKVMTNRPSFVLNTTMNQRRGGELWSIGHIYIKHLPPLKIFQILTIGMLFSFKYFY